MRGLAIPVFMSCATLAVMSQVYLFHINTTIPASLATSRSAADQFIVSGKGASHLLIEGSIFQGFRLTALACLILCSSAAVLVFFMRTRARKKGARLLPRNMSSICQSRQRDNG